MDDEEPKLLNSAASYGIASIILLSIHIVPDFLKKNVKRLDGDIVERIIFYELQIESVLARTGDGGDAELLFIREKIGAYLAAKS